MLYSNVYKSVNEKTFQKEGKEIKINYVRLGEEGRGRQYRDLSCQGIDKIEKGFNNNIKLSKTRSGRTKLVKGNSEEKLIILISTLTRYIKGAYGKIVGILTDEYAYENFEDLEKYFEVLEVANGAWGQAGRAGYWIDYLLKMKEIKPVTIKIRPSRGDHHKYLRINSATDVEYFENWEDYILYMDNMN
ncbi:hypothetical protein [Oceanotoga phage vB_OteS-UFV02]